MGYTWKRLGEDIDMNKTLDEIGIVIFNDLFIELM